MPISCIARMKHGLVFLFCISSLFLMGLNLNAQEINPFQKAAIIYQFSRNVQWENEEEIDTFTIGVYGSENDLVDEMKSILSTAQWKGKPISVVQFFRLNEVTRTHVLYIPTSKNFDIRRIFDRIVGWSTLLITDRCDDELRIMINLLPPKENLPQFEVFSYNMINENMTPMPDLLELGGTEIDAWNLFRESQKDLQDVQEQAAQLSDSLNIQNEEIRKRNTEIDSQRTTIDGQRSSILLQQEDITRYEAEISTQRLNLDDLLKQEDRQQQTLNEAKVQMDSQRVKNDRQQREIEIGSAKLELIRQQTDSQEQKIEEQNTQLTESAVREERQKSVIIIIVIFCFLILGMIFFIYRGYKIKKNANKELEEMNLAVTKQNREISKQKQEIQEKNDELNKNHEEILAQSDELKQANEEILSTNEALQNQKQELQFTLENLKLAQDQLIQSEKLASVGQLTAGIAHELNNPINFISGNVKPLKRDLDDIFTILKKYDAIIKDNDLEKYFDEMNSLKEKLDYKFLTDEVKSLLEGVGEGAHRSGEIVKGLRTFSRIDDDKFKMADIHDGIDSTLVLLFNKIKDKITLHKEYGDLPQIECLPSKINQVFMNILTNSIQSIEKKGDIFIETISSGIGVKIIIRDTGSGMSSEVKKHIFEPFYTTKEVGKGTGLGLSISYGIIEQHNGNIDVISAPGKGTEFIISIPISQPSNS